MTEKGKPQHRLYKSIRKRVAPPTIRHKDKKKDKEKEKTREKIRPQDWDMYDEDFLQ